MGRYSERTGEGPTRMPAAKSQCRISLGSMSQEIEIGLGKKARLAYALDDVAIVPSRRTRDPQDVSTSWQVDAYEFDIPVIAAPMDSVTSPATAIAMGKLGGLGVLDLEGLWTRYEDPQPLLDEIAALDSAHAIERIQQIYAEPVKPELITQRLHEIRDAGVTVAGALSPQRTQQFYSTVVDAGVDLFVIRGTAVSSTRTTIGVQAPLATAISDVAEARRDYMDESGGRYVQVIADGGMGDSGNFVKAFALGADAVMLGTPLARAAEAPGKGMHWGAEARHQTLPRGYRVNVGTVAPLEQILFGPSHQADGRVNFIGALRRAMASTGYVNVKDFQRCDMVVTPYAAH